MASAQDVRRRIATVITPVANLVAAQGPGGALRQVIEIAIDGYGRLPSAKTAAARHLQRQAGSVDEAINSIIDHHVRLASAQGFVTNIGGVAALPVAIPANITGVAIVQVRMVAAAESAPNAMAVPIPGRSISRRRRIEATNMAHVAATSVVARRPCAMRFGQKPVSVMAATPHHPLPVSRVTNRKTATQSRRKIAIVGRRARKSIRFES